MNQIDKDAISVMVTGGLRIANKAHDDWAWTNEHPGIDQAQRDERVGHWKAVLKRIAELKVVLNEALND